MGRIALGPILGRVLAVIGILVIVGLIMELMAAILEPVLPAWLMAGLSGGWTLLLSIVSPALAAIFAVLTVAALVWVVIGPRW